MEWTFTIKDHSYSYEGISGGKIMAIPPQDLLSNVDHTPHDFVGEYGYPDSRVVVVPGRGFDDSGSKDLSNSGGSGGRCLHIMNFMHRSFDSINFLGQTEEEVFAFWRLVMQVVKERLLNTYSDTSTADSASTHISISTDDPKRRHRWLHVRIESSGQGYHPEYDASKGITGDPEDNPSKSVEVS